ncbi:hypothetical protein [Rhodohalobacter sulfatireducens]|uniref:Uncharacterized protein n=1 Tax=Rhodohalobacter sulfatireducens TaxID=2911366 RepID=A0ABS9KIC4_9BACT|nr:hypothetical protein [Rhodohalobacter sulfatireducens]MCG2590586.1 hypothetical protein [Rhodohalobacter sulfatireducens]
MKKLHTIPLSIFLLILFCVDLKAQVGPEETSAYDLSEMTHLGGTRIYSVNSTDIEGTPLLNDEFKKGRFLFTSGNQSEIVPINYDLEQNLILFKKDDQIMILENVDVKGFSFEPPRDYDRSENVQEKYTFRVSDSEFDFTEPTPVQVLYDQNGAIKLFAIHKVKFVRGNRQDPFTGKITNRYKSDTEYFLKIPGNEMHKLRRLRAKEIINALGGDSKKELYTFIDENDLDDKSERDLVRLLAHYESKITAGNE